MKRDPSGYWSSIGIKGDLPGHPFRGNQYTDVAGAGDLGGYSEDTYSRLSYDKGEVRTNIDRRDIVLHDSARQQCYEFARDPKNKESETGFVVADNQLYLCDNGHLQMRVPDYLSDRMEHLVHSHPSGSPFSDSDIANVWAHPNQSSIEAVTPNGTVYRLERLRGVGREDIVMARKLKGEWWDRFNALRERYRDRPDALIKNRKVTPRFVEECDRIVRKIAAKYPKDMKYTITKIKAEKQMLHTAKSSDGAGYTEDFDLYDDRWIADPYWDER